MNIKEAMDFVNSVPVFAGSFGNNADMLTLLKRLGNPQEGQKFIHVAGTNGKGSVCAYIAAGLAAAGYKTGLYVSPYLVSFNERIQINGSYITNDRLCELAERVKVQTDGLRLSQFALITAIMLLFFHEEHTEYSVIEVGLGGRHDPTNVIDPKLTVITPVSLDHTAVLGSTLREIAGEKSGIIKSGVPLVLMPQQAEAKERILAEAAEKQAPVIPAKSVSEVKTGIDGTSFKIDGTSFSLKMPGAYQAENAAAALTALELLNACSKLSINAVENTVWHGRLQVMSKKPFILADGAHNPGGAHSLADFLKAVGGRFTVVTGMAADKDCAGVATLLSPFAKRVLTVPIQSPRSISAAGLLEIYSACGVSGRAFKTLDEAMTEALKYGDGIVICGSLYLVGEYLRRSGTE